MPPGDDSPRPDERPAAAAARLERFRGYLGVLARLGMSPALRRRVGPSDLVQETLIEAYQALDRFDGGTDEELARWLRRILANNLANAVRDNRRQKRALDRDVPLETQLEESSLRLERCFAADGTSPSGKAMRRESVVDLAQALSQLSPLQLEVVLQHHVQGVSLREIAAELEVTRYAVTLALREALRRLRHDLSDSYDQ